MPSGENLLLAMAAVAYAREVFTVGASNKVPDLVSTLGKSFLCVVASRSVEIAVPAEPLGNDPATATMLRAWAAKAAELGCGNCGEQAAVAFMYLADRGTRPLDYMALVKPGDHAYVVIGRSSQSRASDYTTWGEDAVVCDPWDNKAFLASAIPQFLYKKGTIKSVSLLRVD